MNSGIYKITNMINGKSYIGLSINIKNRFIEHIRTLNKNKHHNIKLQRAWNKYSEKNFNFEILELCSVEELGKRESYFVKLYDSYENGYNLTPGGEEQYRGKHNGNHNKTKYTFYNIDGRIAKDITCLDFVIKYGYKNNGKCHIYSVASGNRDVFDGWVKDIEVLKQSRKGFKYKFYNIDGTETEYLTQMEFNIKYNINNDGNVSALILGKVKQHKGWFKSKEDMELYLKSKESKKRTLINEAGDILDNITQEEFRKITGCASCSSSQLFNGKYQIVKGWKLLNNENIPY